MELTDISRQQADRILVGMGLIQAVVVAVLVAVNPNHFTTIDSHYYLEAAQHLTEGKGYVVEQAGTKAWNATFPMGYSALIALVSGLTGLPVLWASKVLHLLLSSGWLWWVRATFSPGRAVSLGPLLLLGTYLKLWAHTWSEPAFLVVLSMWVWYFFQEKRTSFFLLLGLGYALFLLRYMGAFIIPLSIAWSLWGAVRGQPKRAIRDAALGVGWLTGACGWFYLNYTQSGSWSGGERFTEHTALLELGAIFGKGLLNEALLLRDFGSFLPDPLVWTGIAVQVVVFTRFYRLGLFEKNVGAILDTPARFYWLSAVFYLVVLVILRALSPFELTGYRFFTPFSFLILWGLLLAGPPVRGRLIWPWLLLLLLGSWLQLLPEGDWIPKLAALLGLGRPS